MTRAFVVLFIVFPLVCAALGAQSSRDWISRQRHGGGGGGKETENSGTALSFPPWCKRVARIFLHLTNNPCFILQELAKKPAGGAKHGVKRKADSLGGEGSVPAEQAAEDGERKKVVALLLSFFFSCESMLWK